MIPREEVPLLDENESAVDALAELSGNNVHRALVVDDGHLIGLLSITDIFRVRALPAALAGNAQPHPRAPRCARTVPVAPLVLERR
jgi:CBS domain-containing protein